MKPKVKIRPAEMQEEKDEAIEVEASGPAIAAAKKSKIAIIAASTILTILVFYFFFFKEPEKPNEKLEAIEPPKAVVAQRDTAKTAFEFDDTKDKQKQEVEDLAKPATPDVPVLPDLPKDTSASANQVNLGDINSPNQPAVQQLLPNQVLPGQPGDNKQVLPGEINNPASPNAPIGQNNSSLNLSDKKPVDPRYAPIIVLSGNDANLPARGVGYDKNIVKLKKDPFEELKATENNVPTTYISDMPHTIAQGKLITAVLETAINTEIPGLVRAIIARDVYGESGSEVLIPKGSRLYGSYSSEIRQGQGRVQINWSRLIRPDGVDLAISSAAADQFGRSGIAGEVDNKYGSIITNSLLTSVLAVGGVAAAQSLLGDQATTTTTNPTQGTTTSTGNATNQALYDVTRTIVDTVGQIVNSALNITPVIRVPQGTRITVIVNSDIKVPSMARR